MQFCPCCGNILLIEPSPDGMRLFCQTCPYVYRIQTRIEKRVKLHRKQVDDILGGDEAWDKVEKTEGDR
ncbi:hypothetical protein ABG067_001891 [Albugo candida]|uniref:DNA-directed RNA polymerase II subunit RPB9-like zinc ribbon domain-containing protein n=1 Tax=Albugo candida TaxID=65357 RepID=A0A024GUW7_9STRA|nr:unnamed protein product [Albugo candida]|eukprot:CCI50391.1 unnamed protein product [Albugo candida]